MQASREIGLCPEHPDIGQGTRQYHLSCSHGAMLCKPAAAGC